NYNTITWTAVAGAYQYKIYRCTGAACTPLNLTTVANSVTSYNDQAAGSPSGSVPASNTTGSLSLTGILQGASAAFSGKVTATQGFYFVVSWAPFATYSGGKINVGSNANSFEGIDFQVRNDTAITAENIGYNFTRAGQYNLGGNFATQRMMVVNAPAYT